MCGFCGIFHNQITEALDIDIRKMNDIMFNRGPDSFGIETLPNITLAHRRLKIIDLSSDGSQPMRNENGDIWLVFNGEIYNYLQLKVALENKGHSFISKTDSEVLIHGYEEWGTDILKKIKGMFAFGIYDLNLNKLILSRDPIGKKPLYYCQQNDVVYFSSDIKALFMNIPGVKTISVEALDCYLNHIAVPDQHAIFKDINKVYPGTYIIFDKNRQNTHTFWEWNFSIKTNSSEDEIVNKTEQLLTDSIEKRLISDVPLGVMQSGGVDSSIITAILSKIRNEKLNTFTVGFKNYDMQDVHFARKVAEKFKTEHKELILDFNITEHLIKLVWEFGEPFADSSAIPTYYISKVAKEYISVMLTGDGGDEVFGGYGRSISAYNAKIFSKFFPKAFHPITKNLLKLFKTNPTSPSFLGKVLYYIEYIEGFPLKSFYNTMGYNNYRDKIWNKKYLNKLSNHNPLHPFWENFGKVQSLDEIDQVLFTDGRTRLMYDYLVKIDRATMANSIEARSPFLDIDLLNYSAQIPAKIKFKNRQTKYILKKIGEKYLPKELLYREKQGFSIPIASWINNELYEIIPKILFHQNSASREYFNIEFIEFLLKEHKEGRGNHQHRIWALLWFELWHLMFIKKLIDKETNFADLVVLL